LREIGQRIRDARQARKISIRKFADLLDVSFSYLSKVERGEVVAANATYERICEILDLDSEELLATIGLVDTEYEQDVKGFLRKLKKKREK
jgi:transcriptional regulator with XRE-family HTH domain